MLTSTLSLCILGAVKLMDVEPAQAMLPTSICIEQHRKSHVYKAKGKTCASGAAEVATNASAQPRKPDMIVKLEAKPQASPKAGIKPEAAATAKAPAKKPGQLFLPQPSTVKNAYVLMAQNK